MTNPVGNANAKLGGLFSTYNPVGPSCPSSCRMLNAGCYAQAGHVQLAQRRATMAEGSRLGAVERAAVETKLAGLPAFRLHVSGDFHNGDRVDWSYVIGVREIVEFHGVEAWAYTHERSPAVVAAMRETLGPNVTLWHSDHAGPGGAVVVPDFAALPKGTVACPAQSRDKTCKSCKLCFNPRAHARVTIAFEAHGAGRKRLLPMLRDTP